ncbi:MAG TPA: HAMP domain-containing sensor histidine kinase [Galbitalea sp.]
MRWFRGRTIRGRITLWTVLISIVLTSAAAFAFRAGVEAIVASSTRSLLASNGASYEASLHAGQTANFPKPGDDQLVAVVDPTGKVIVTSLPESLNHRMDELLALGRGLRTVTSSSKAQYDVVNEPVNAPSGTWHVIEARNKESGEEVLGGLTLLLIVGVIALVIGFGISAWIVTGLALRPVSAMRRKASELSHSSSADTLPVGDAHDELSALAVTLNAFITSVRSSADRERQMVADASHELRSPVAVLRTQLQLAHLSSGDAAALESEIGAAELSVERLSNLTTNLLTLSRIEAGEDDQSTRGDLLLAEFLIGMDRAIVLGSAHSVSVDFATTDVDDTFSVAIVLVDFGGLVDNLVSNAIAASPRGASVEVDLSRRGDELVLTVVDSGHGISDSFLPVAFDRFSRADASRPRPGGGNGLGLAIVKATVVRAGGAARLEQRAEGGVRAVVELPVTPS